jgi:CRISPR/Cas system CSM-associated protein Csm2 small subunit
MIITLKIEAIKNKKTTYNNYSLQEMIKCHMKYVVHNAHMKLSKLLTVVAMYFGLESEESEQFRENLSDIIDKITNGL